MRGRFICISGAAIIFIGLGIYTLQTTTLTSAAEPTASKAAPPVKESDSRHSSDAFATMGPPQELVIPSLDIKSTIRPVGLTPEGAMDIPDSLTDTGWFEQSATPGSPGKAVLAAHTGFPKQPTQFRALEHTSLGTVIEIKDKAGSTAHFEVIDIGRYTPQNAPRGHIFGTSPTARLNIITCTGDWNPATNSYDQRLVLYAARIH